MRRATDANLSRMPPQRTAISSKKVSRYTQSWACHTSQLSQAMFDPRAPEKVLQQQRQVVSDVC